MTRHIFTLVWNRKRSSGLIFAEILISFLVLCAVLTVALQFRRLAQEPLGYDYADVWEVEVGGLGAYRENDEEQLFAARRQLGELVRGVRALPEVIAASLAGNTPFSGSTSNTGMNVRGEPIQMLASNVEAQLAPTLRLEVLAGRWLQEDDLAQNWEAVVVTRSLARAFFGLDDPIGRDLPLTDDNGEPRAPQDEAEIMRVVGVVADYKKSGRFDPAPHGLFGLIDFDDLGSYVPTTLLVRLQPGTPRGFEQQLVATLRGAAPDWTFDVSVLDDRRLAAERNKLLPLIIGAVVAGFLILMVGLGLVGVLYQNVVRRTAELGLRRALGASGAGVRRQVLAELLALTTLAVALGAVVFLQTPLLGIAAAIPAIVVVEAVVLAAALIYAFVAVCGAYPSWLATRVQPALALQHE